MARIGEMTNGSAQKLRHIESNSTSFSAQTTSPITLSMTDQILCQIETRLYALRTTYVPRSLFLGTTMLGHVILKR